MNKLLLRVLISDANPSSLVEKYGYEAVEKALQ
jgi:hypothetical protein